MVLRLYKGLLNRLRQLKYRVLGVHIQGHCSIGQISIPKHFQSITIAKDCALDDRVTLLSVDGGKTPGLISIGEGTYINRNSMIDASLSVLIGEHCGIGPNCYITDHDHRFDFKTPPLALPLKSEITSIGNYVWIGANSVILKGVTIGDYSVIGAGSVVTKNIPAFSIAVGNPARITRSSGE
jgi:acetyltransferase-like isoleucine patch superfamily enzyme